MIQISECLQHYVYVHVCLFACENAHVCLHLAMASPPAWPGLDLVPCLCSVFAAYNIKLYSFVPPFINTRCSPVGMHDVEIKAIRKTTQSCNKLLLIRIPSRSCSHAGAVLDPVLYRKKYPHLK